MTQFLCSRNREPRTKNSTFRNSDSVVNFWLMLLLWFGLQKGADFPLSENRGDSVRNI